jgi:hypothetical protein
MKAQREASPMSRILPFLLVAMISVGLSQGVKGQGVVYYPPASGHMQIVPPVFTAPGAVGSPYIETFPAFGSVYQTGPSNATRQVVPYGTQVRPAPAPRVRGRAAKSPRVYSRGYNQAPAPYATQLPVGQLQWQDPVMTPGYTPFSRFGSYGSGYGVSPYGSNFWGGYYKGFPMIGN